MGVPGGVVRTKGPLVTAAEDEFTGGGVDSACDVLFLLS